LTEYKKGGIMIKINEIAIEKCHILTTKRRYDILYIRESIRKDSCCNFIFILLTHQQNKDKNDKKK